MPKIQIKEAELWELLQSPDPTADLLDQYFKTVFVDPFSGYRELPDDVEVIPHVSGEINGGMKSILAVTDFRISLRNHRYS